VAIEFKIPELGENVKGGDVLRVLVRVGDTIARDQGVLELETDKATIEVPSTAAGKVTEIKVKEGDKVKVGQTILMLDDVASTTASAPAVTQNQAEARVAAGQDGGAAVGADAGGDDSVDATVEGGLKQEVPGAVHAPATDKPGRLEDDDELEDARRPLRVGRAEVVDISRGARAATATAAAAVAAAAEAAPASSRAPAPAAPSVRRIARELGVDINEVAGSGPQGRISADDVTAHAKRIITGVRAGGGLGLGAGVAAGRAFLPSVALPDFSKWGEIERKPVRGVRRKTAEHLADAWLTVPHVTQCDKADITALEALRAKFGKRVQAAGGKLTVTAIALKAVATALKVFPQFNASIDMTNEELIYKKYYHIGVAVDTDRGLLVPVMRDVDKKNIIELSAELAQAAERARTKKTTLEEMEGGCFTITNLGGIGGTYFTPIVNAPEVAILGMSRAQMEPVYVNGTFEPRLMLPLSLSYDHRVIDGADGIRFLRFLVEALEQPFVLSLQG
jgi:pyruvate dehydrogenase E2 component (dihydrolipoamide acetyltransferase)